MAYIKYIKGKRVVEKRFITITRYNIERKYEIKWSWRFDKFTDNEFYMLEIKKRRNNNVYYYYVSEIATNSNLSTNILHIFFFDLGYLSAQFCFVKY